MSKDPARGATTIRPSKSSTYDNDEKGGGGGGGKLLLGVVAAAVLVGGGYFVWKTYGGAIGAQTAYNDSYNSDSYADDPLRVGALEANDSTIAESTSPDAAAPPASASRATSTPARRQTADASAAVPEETIGIMPINATSAEAATGGGDIVVTAARRPIWVRTPSARRLSALYPERALERGREGEARLSCTVQGDGALACARVEETPGGFGPAALRVARTLRHAPQLADGSDATGSPVNLRVVFRMDDSQRHG